MSGNTVIELQQKKADFVEDMQGLLDQAEAEDRDLTVDEAATYEDLAETVDQLERRIGRLEDVETRQQLLRRPARPAIAQIEAPAVLNIGRGDSEERAFAHYIRTGDVGGLEYRASNDTDMNVGTAADGGNAVPTGHHNEIIARRDESMLAQTLGVRMIPGVGTTVNVPTDDEADGEFVSTAEAGATDRDAPALGQKAMTLVKYTKKVELSVELLEDEDSRLLTFLADFVGRGIAKTHNNLLLTEVAANGTSLKTFASATAIAAGEPEDIVSNNDLSAYLDNDTAVGWVMRSATYWDILSLTGNDRLYAQQVIGATDGRRLLGYPVHYSQKAAATAASAKDVYFGNWSMVGVREAPGLTVLRDPFSKAGNGQVVLHYYFRTVYGVLQAEAVGYAEHPSA